MDLSDPTIWKEGTEVVLNNLHIVAPLVAATAAGAWWLRGLIFGERIKIWETQYKLLEQRLQQADDGGRLVTRNYEELATEVRSLTAQLSAGSSKEVLKIVETIGSKIAELSDANTELSDALKSRDPDQNAKLVPSTATGVKEFSGVAPPNLTHTKVLSAEIGGRILNREVTTWNGLLNEAIMQAAAKFKDPSAVKELIRANSVIGKKEDQGYRFIASAGLSVQGQDANSAWKAASHIAKIMRLPAKVVFVWYDNEKAAYPGQTGKLTLNA